MMPLTPNENLEFSFDLASIDRQTVLQEAGRLIDAGRSHLSSGSMVPPTTAEGDLVRDLIEDYAELAGMPDVYRITEKDFLDRQRPVPVRFQELSRQWRFFWVRFPIGLMPRRNWAFNRLEVKVEFNPGGTPGTRPKSYQILPEKRFQNLLMVTDRLEVSIDEKFEFNAKAAGDVGVAKAQATAVLGGQAGFKMVAGPYEHRVSKAKIDNSGTGLEWVFWRLDGGEFFQENRPDLVVIVQVPREAKHFTVAAAMQAYRFFNYAAADFQDAIKGLPSLVASFFRAGAPLGDRKQYDLTAQL
jgi:hypothetical protein